jgi:hypothetical protein
MADGDDEAAKAFDDLRSEVSLLRRAVERLAAERAEPSEMPDYAETLGVISQNLSATAQRVDALVHSPALSLTPEELGRQTLAASYNARREDHRAFVAAREGLDEVATKIGRQLESRLMADEQRQRVRRVGMIGLALGMALWAIAGPIVRTVPVGWHWPERMAARSLRMPMWEGGQHLMRTASPAAFVGIAANSRMAVTNREVLEACRTRAAKAEKAVRCTIEVEVQNREK